MKRRKPIRKRSKRPLATMKAKTWKEFSIFVRRSNSDRDGNVSCITCSKVFHWKEVHAGHFRHGVLDFDPMNINPQCAGCNTYRAGKLDIYSRMLTLKYGHEAVEALHARADLAVKGEKYDIFQLEEIYTRYKKLNGLEK